MNALSLGKASLAALAVAALAGGCTTPYSKVDGNFDMPTTEINDYPVRIVAVDGQFQAHNDALVEPGMHTLIVASRKRSIFRIHEEKAVGFKVEPCTHYYLAARHPGKLDEHFDLVVRKTEPVPGCDMAKAMSMIKQS